MKKQLKKYRVYCEYTESHEEDIEANSKEEAEELFYHQNYIDGQVTYICIDEIEENE